MLTRLKDEGGREEGEGDVNSCWEKFKESVIKAAKKVLPKKERQTRRKWMTTEILELMKERKNFK